jgi:hypothetical protein
MDDVEKREILLLPSPQPVAIKTGTKRLSPSPTSLIAEMNVATEG